MLRRLSTFLVCFVLIAFVVQTAEAQAPARILHIGATDADGNIRDGGLDIDTGEYYFASLESAWSKAADTYELKNGQFDVEFRLYRDQLLEEHDALLQFYTFSASSAAARNIYLTTAVDPDTQEAGSYKISTTNAENGLPPNTDFLESIATNVSLNIDSHITIAAGGQGPGNYNNATSVNGSRLTAQGVTFRDGGPVVVNSLGTTGGANRGSYATWHSTVQLQGASFINNRANDNSSNAALAIYNPSSVDLRNTTFLDNQDWGAYIYNNDITYNSTGNFTVQLGTTADYEGAASVFQGNTGGAIRFGGQRAGIWNTTPTTNVSINGNLSMYDAIGFHGEAGSYNLRINQGSGTWWLAEGLTNHFENYSNQGTGDRGTIVTINGSSGNRAILDMSKDSKFVMEGHRDQFILGGSGTMILRGSTQPGANDPTTYGNYIETHTFTMQNGAIFNISGTVLNELYNRNTGLNEPILTIDAVDITQPGTGNMIYFDIYDIRGDIVNKVIIRNVNTDPTGNNEYDYFRNANNQPSGGPQYGRTYIARLDGEDVIPFNNRISGGMSIGNVSGDPTMGGHDLILNLTFRNTIATFIPLTGSSSINWNLVSNQNWRYETKSYVYPESIGSSNMHYSSFVTNDAVVFNNETTRNFTLYLRSSDGVNRDTYVSQQAGFMTYHTKDASGKSIQIPTVEYGMRVSGDRNWSFIGGSICDDFDPKMTQHTEQLNHVARLTFDGTGTLNLFNDRPNSFHDGTYIGSFGYHIDEHPDTRTYFTVNTDTQTIVNAYGLGALGDGKYAGETAKVREIDQAYIDAMLAGTLIDSDYDADYIVQQDGFGVQFVGYGGTVLINHEQTYGGSTHVYESLESDREFSQRIRVIQGGVMDGPGSYVNDVNTTAKIEMAPNRLDADGNRIQILVRTDDAYWINNHKFTDNTSEGVSTLNSGGSIFVHSGADITMTGDFILQNRILTAYQDENGGMQQTAVDPDTFYGGAVWAGLGSSIDLTGLSIIGNGRFFTRTNVMENGKIVDYLYTANSTGSLSDQVQCGGAIFFTGGKNKYKNNEVATLKLSAGVDGRTRVEDNVANVGGAIYVSQGAGAEIYVENVDFVRNFAMQNGGVYDPVGGGAIYIWNEPDAEGNLDPVYLFADGAGFDNNIANIAPGGAIRLFQGSNVKLNDASFMFNGVTVSTATDPDTGEETREIDQIVTTYGGAIFTGGSTIIEAVGASFVSNAALGDGGAVFTVGEQDSARSNSFDFSGGTFEGNIAEGSVSGSGYGGAIFSVYTKLTGDGATFEKNVAQIDGGAVYVFGGQTDVENDVFDFSNATFRENEAVTGRGGAIYTELTRLIGVDSQFEYNKAAGDGGAIFVQSLEKVQGAVIDFGTDTTTSRQTIFRGNDAGGEGGAIFLAPGDLTLIIDNAIFEDNTTGKADARGGAIFAGNEKVTITGRNVRFSNNMYGTDGRGQGQYGGAIYLGDYGTINLHDNFGFNGNRVTHADGRGGAIYTGIGATLSLTNGSFDANIAMQEGGAIYTATDVGIEGKLTFTGTSFSNNRSERASGGAIYAVNMVVSGEESDFYMNRAATKGGALHIVSDYALDADHASKTIVLENSVFEYNIADGAGDDNGGGAIFIGFNGATLEADGSQFLGNVAESHGGAIYGQADTVLNVNDAAFDVSYDNPLRGNTSLNGCGGAIYLNGSLNNAKVATSTLNAKGTTFISGFAGVNGGAVYLYYADADISGAVFRYNTAGGLGGGLYYENEPGKELIIESTIFEYNQAASGGAVYTVNATLLQAKDTSLRGNQASAGDGGAIYFAAENSQLNISRSGDSDAVIEFNTATGDGGAIRMQKNSKLIANGSVFNENEAGGTGGAIRIDGYADIQAANSTFYKNTAMGGGGAIMLADDSVQTFSSVLNLLNLNGSRFQQNTSGADGGAIHATNTNLNIGSSLFVQNRTAGNGGAVYVKNSDLNAWGTGFQNNAAGTIDGTDSKGGAVYFLTTNELERNIYLGAATGAQTFISGNTMNGVANSIYFDARGGSRRSNVTLNVATEEGGRLTMQDPMQVDRTAANPGNNLNLDIVKTGNGIWELGGTNDFSFTRAGTTMDIRQGTFGLLPGAKLILTNEYDGQDYFNLHSGATFSTGGSSTSTGAAELKASHLNFAVNTKMVLDEELILDISNNYSIASRLSGNGALTKQDASWLTFYGATNNYNGNVSIKHGKFSIAKHNDVTGSGRFETGGSFYMGPGTHLYMIADVTQPTLVAKSATIDLVNLHVSGIVGDYGKEFILIHTTDGIYGNFANVEADGSILSSVDYLTFNLGFLNDRKDYGGSIGLRWYSTDTSMPAWGRFTLKDEDDYFNVAVELHDNNYNLYTGDPNDPGYDPDWPWRWDGTTLDKLGLGTLELSARNTYTGETTVHAGELYVTNPFGTGLGDAEVDVLSGARLGLNFNGTYEKNVTGEGKIVIRGGTVELVGENTYSGGTDLKDGVLEFTTKENLGTGTITFDGGTLRNLAEATLDQNIVITDRKTAKFDVPLYQPDASVPSLTVTSIISGGGDLEKTGLGTLALAGANTYTGTSYVRQGGLKIDGSVAGDVRVSQYAAVGGTGTVGGDLFINSGGYFDWYFTPNRSESGPLNVAGSVNLANGSVFRPRTDSTDFTESIVGWVVMTYGGTLGGQFTAVDDTFNAYYNFSLDYSQPGEIRVDGELLTRPKAMGDIVATSLALANKKLYRNAFSQMMRETTYRKMPTPGYDSSVRGQAGEATRSMWFTPMARANKFGTTFVGGNYDFEAYGMQAGSTLWSNNNNTLGLMFGYERGNLRNRLDQIRSHDYYLGLYYGHLFNDGIELRSFLGGGFQKYTMFRNDTEHQYTTSYDGSSFEMNVELGKLFAGQNGTLLRPYIAADIEHGTVSSAQENKIGNAYRNYDKSDLSQFFVRFGLDLEKRWQYVDLNGGLGYSCLLLGKRRAEASIFYPVRGAGTPSHSARLGRSSLLLKTGLNWHLDRRRMNTIFLDYFADIYMDRAGDTVQHQAGFGYQLRF